MSLTNLIRRQVAALLVFNTLIASIYAQKSNLEVNDLIDPPDVTTVLVSNSGDFVVYSTTRSHKRYWLYAYNTVQKTTDLIASGANNLVATICDRSHFVAFMVTADSLCLYNLKTKEKIFFTNCKKYQFISDETDEWIACLLADGDFLFYNLSTQEIRRQKNIYNFYYNGISKIVVTQHTSKVDSVVGYSLCYFDLKKNVSREIFAGGAISNLTFDKSGKQICFTVKSVLGSNTFGNKIWVYDGLSNASRPLVIEAFHGFPETFFIDNRPLKFSSDGNRIFFYASIYPSVIKTVSHSSKVDVWSYADDYLQTEQIKNSKSAESRVFLAMTNLQSGKTVVLEKLSDALFSQLNYGANENYLLTKTSFNHYETSRLPDSSLQTFLVNTSTGERLTVTTGFANSIHFFSPGGKYVVWYDAKSHAYYTYDISTKIIRNITSDISKQLRRGEHFTIGLWAYGDEFVYIEDTYDIWKVDPSANARPVNITNGYGRRSKTRLRFVYKGIENLNSTISEHADVFLCGFEESTNENSFFKSNLSNLENPQKLSQSKKIFYFSDNIGFVKFPSLNIKAKENDLYILKGNSIDEYPNLYSTNDFTIFNRISTLEPQKDKNWLTSELVRWKTDDGKPISGILYKPENFDPKKKYPVIVYIYSNLSEGVHQFPSYGLSVGTLAIPLFVSNGYIVFCPDIKRSSDGKNGWDAYNSVISGIRTLSSMSWINPSKIGIQGHSYGGYEVNYLITTTDNFAAASSSAGMTNFVSLSGTLRANLHDSHDYQIYGQNHLGATLWADRDIYIDNSPIFFANKVKTPLLMMHNKLDVQVPWSQGIEFFTALRYLRKKSWLLQYDDSGHTLDTETDQLDYTKRLKQFFDHYLKEQPPPKWMTQGRPASLKQIDDRFELDPEGFCGKDCEICKEKKYDKQTLHLRTP